jgi:hypothetical protein
MDFPTFVGFSILFGGLSLAFSFLLNGVRTDLKRIADALEHPRTPPLLIGELANIRAELKASNDLRQGRIPESR